MSAAGRPDASIVVPTAGRRDAVARLLTSLGRQTVGADGFETIVVLNGVTDGTDELVERFEAPYRLVVLREEKRGRAAACNTGAARASAETVVFLDDDMDPTPDWLAAHIDRHRETPRAAVMGAVPIAVTAQTSPLERWIARNFEEHHARLSSPERPFHLRDFYTGNTSFPTAVFAEVGGFDDAYTQYGHEDLEFLVRLREANVGVVFEPRAVARQSYEKTFAAFARDMRGTGRTAVQLAETHAEAAAEVTAFRGGPRGWANVRALLLRASRYPLGVPHVVVALAGLLERVAPQRTTLFYELASDYFFWLGVQDAGGTTATLTGKTGTGAT
jgi:GT2 family glycosyltransferase